jgi:hypothetical protein
MITIETKELAGLRDALNTLYALRDHEYKMSWCHSRLGETDIAASRTKKAEKYQTIINQILPAVKTMERT